LQEERENSPKVFKPNLSPFRAGFFSFKKFLGLSSFFLKQVKKKKKTNS